jgi:hypothetical protein
LLSVAGLVAAANGAGGRTPASDCLFNVLRGLWHAFFDLALIGTLSGAFSPKRGNFAGRR